MHNYEAESDRLLKAHNGLGKSKGVYTESALVKKIKRNEINNIKSWITEQYYTYQVDLHDFTVDNIESICRFGKMAESDIFMIKMHVLGFTISSIAEVLEIPKSTAYHRYEKIKNRLIQLINNNPYFFWYEVYLEEIGRK